MFLPIGEIAVRIFSPQPPSWIAIFRRLDDLPFFGLVKNTQVQIDNGESSWLVVTDDEGLRISGKPSVQEATNNCWVFGDSFSFGNAIDYEKAFIYLLSQDNQHKCRYKNFAIPGYGPRQYRKILEKALRENTPPEFVLITIFLGNDFNDLVINMDMPVNDGVLGNPDNYRAYVKIHSHLYRLVSRVYHIMFDKDESNYIRRNITQADFDKQAYSSAKTQMKEELLKIYELLTSRSIPFAVVSIPIRSTIDSVFRGRTPEDVRHLIFGEIAKSIDLPHISLLELLAEENSRATHFYFDSHFNEHGNNRVYQYLKRELAQYLVDREDRSD